MGNYLIHSLKYFLKLVLLLVMIYLLMYLTGTLGISTDELFGRRGIVLLAAMIGLAAAYPSFGFISRRVNADPAADREEILKACRMNNYTLCSERGGTMKFHASSPARRLWYIFDDTVTVTADGTGIVISGNRKEVVQIEFRLTSYLQNKTEE